MAGSTTTTSSSSSSSSANMAGEQKGQVLVYSIIGCPHCLRAKSSLNNEGLSYVDVSIDKYNPSVREEVQKKTGKVTVPQIFFNEVHIGGNQELINLFGNKQEWKKMKKWIMETPPGCDCPQKPPDDFLLDEADADGALHFVCEPDEYAYLVKQIKEAGIIKAHKAGLLTSYKNSFTGKDLVDWLVESKKVDRHHACEMGQALVEQHFGHQLNKNAIRFEDRADAYYRLLEDDESTALNASSDTSTCRPRPASELGEDLRKLILKLYNKNLTPDGRSVDYDGIAKSEEFKTYEKLTRELHRVELEASSRQEKLAFFINVYNALVIHGTVVRGVPDNLWARYKFFNTVRYIIGGFEYSLQDIENGVLRGNRKGVGMWKPPFKKKDPRLQIALDTAEPLIHFGLNCGAKSCPPIKTYTTKGVMNELKVAAEAFLESSDGASVDVDNNTLSLSQIFKWYREDFGVTNNNIVEFVYNHLGQGRKKEELARLMEGGEPIVKFQHYDWGSNKKVSADKSSRCCRCCVVL